MQKTEIQSTLKKIRTENKQKTNTNIVKEVILPKTKAVPAAVAMSCRNSNFLPLFHIDG